MITAQKMKLLLNDPKFYALNSWDQNNVQQALKKIYAAQKQIRRSIVINDSTKKSNRIQQQVDTQIDFIVERVNTIQKKLVLDIQHAYLETQKIKEKYSQMQTVHIKNATRMKKILENIGEQPILINQIDTIENEVQQIQKIYEENIILKQNIQEMKRKIENKKNILKSMRDRI